MSAVPDPPVQEAHTSAFSLCLLMCSAVIVSRAQEVGGDAVRAAPGLQAQTSEPFLLRNTETRIHSGSEGRLCRSEEHGSLLSGGQQKRSWSSRGLLMRGWKEEKQLYFTASQKDTPSAYSGWTFPQATPIFAI